MSSYFGGSQRPMCPNPIHCGGVYNPSHRAQFRHQCPHGKSCPQQYVTSHKEEFAHDLYSVEVRQTLPPVATAPQLVPGPMPYYQPLPYIAGMEGNGPDRPYRDPIRGNRGPDTYTMGEPQGSQAQPQVGVVVPQANGETNGGSASNGKSAAPVPEATPQQGFVVSETPPNGVPLQRMSAQPSMPMVSAMPPPGMLLRPMAAPLPPHPAQPGQPSYAAGPPPQPPSPFPGYYLHQQGK